MFFYSSIFFFFIFFCFKLLTETHTLLMLIWCIIVILLLFILLLIFNLEFYGLLIILIYVGAICVLFLFIIFTLNSSIFKIKIDKQYKFTVSTFFILNCVFFIFFYHFYNYYEMGSIEHLQLLKSAKNYNILVYEYLFVLDNYSNKTNMLSSTTKIKNWLPLENSGLPLFGGIYFFKKYFYCSFFFCWLLFFFVVFLTFCLKLYKLPFKTIYSRLKIQNSFSQMLIRRKK